MKLKIISTGSKGNCYVLQEDDGHTIILDAGLPFPEILEGIDYNIKTLDFALVTHEHMDHFKATSAMLGSGIDVFMSEGTMGVHGLKARPCAHNVPFGAAGWKIVPFSVQHDCVEPLGFLLANGAGHKILYATDTYYLKFKFRGLTHIIIECNYCADILLQNIDSGKLPASMKSRLMHSHMSLDFCIQFLKSIDLTECRKIVLVHLSDGNSNAERMVDEITKATGIDTIAAEDRMIVDFNLFEF
jgi:phosphoribosyl 1,2-cyclic phosphodiesterase